MASGLYVRANVQDEIGRMSGVADHRTFPSSRLKLQMIVMVKPCETSEGHELLRIFVLMELGERRRGAVRASLARANVLEELGSITPEPVG